MESGIKRSEKIDQLGIFFGFDTAGADDDNTVGGKKFCSRFQNMVLDLDDFPEMFFIEAPEGKFPIDYKFTCIKGEIADVFVCSNRESGKPCHCSVDLEWNQLPYIRGRYLPDAIPPRPKHLDRMVEIAKILSEDFDIVRVDLYEYKDKVYFSELTFSPFGGIMYGYNDTGIKEIGKLITKKFKQSKKD